MEELEKYRCPHCGKAVAYKYFVNDEKIKVDITKIKPTECKHSLVIISRRCDKDKCKEIFWVNVSLIPDKQR